VEQSVDERAARWIVAKGWLPQITVSAAIDELRQQPGYNLISLLSARGLLSHTQSQELMVMTAPSAYYSQAGQTQDERPTASLIAAVQSDERAPHRHAAVEKQITGTPYTIGQNFGIYVIEKEISRGGMGAVVKAFHRGMAVHRALKFHLNPNPGEAEVIRFKREAAVLANLEHPNVLRVTDFGYERGAMFFAMELIEGCDLHALVQENYKTRRMAPDEVRLGKIWAAMANALAYCHSQGVIHRDLKPQNILIEDRDQRPVLCDFGLLKRVQATNDGLDSKSDHDLTKTGEVWGTLNFMSPEQLCTKGEFGELSPATDIWGLGASFFFAMTGHYPYPEDNVIDLYNAFKTKAPRLVHELNPDASQWIHDLCKFCLQRNPEQRMPLTQIIEFIEDKIGPQFLPPLPDENDSAEGDLAEELFISQREDSNKVSPVVLLLTSLAVLTPLLLVTTIFSWNPPRFIELQSPNWSSSASCTISGQVDKAELSLAVNGTLLVADAEGRFSSVVPLVEGKNTISVGFLDDSVKQTLTVYCDLNRPRIVIGGSPKKTVFFIDRKRIEARVIEKNLKQLTINGKAVPWNKDGLFAIELNPSNIDKPNRIEIIAEDQAKHVTKRSIVLLPPEAHHYALSNRSWWKQSPERVQDTIVTRVARLLGDQYTLNDIQLYECGAERHRIASFLHKKSGLLLHLIPGGEYLMGVDVEAARRLYRRSYRQQVALLEKYGQSSPETTKKAKGSLALMLSSLSDSLEKEGPRCKVRVKPFLIGRFEVSKSQWALLTGSSLPTQNGNIAQTYLSRELIDQALTGSQSNLRLPSEAEWEYACRGGSEELFFWGAFENELGYVLALENTNRVVQEVSKPEYRSNGFGLFNTLGNAFEWCADDFYPNHDDHPGDGIVRRIEGSKAGVVRGGSVALFKIQCHSAARQSRELIRKNLSDGRHFPHLGLRVALSIPEK
jgi:serine/threonine protein kinase/formylglycine-generating enzyme required for sulfatase activity